MKKIFIFCVMVAVTFAFFTACGNEEANTPPQQNHGGNAVVSETDSAENELKIDHTFINSADGYMRAIKLTAKDKNGEVAWSYTSAEYYLTELETVEYIGCKNGIVYINVQGSEDAKCGIFALDQMTGEVLWINEDYYGASSAYVFDDNGTLYICGFYGPDCVAISKDGKTLWAHSGLTNTWYEPSGIEFDGDRVIITFTARWNGRETIDEINKAVLGTDGSIIEVNEAPLEYQDEVCTIIYYIDKDGEMDMEGRYDVNNGTTVDDDSWYREVWNALVEENADYINPDCELVSVEPIDHDYLIYGDDYEGEDALLLDFSTDYALSARGSSEFLLLSQAIADTFIGAAEFEYNYVIFRVDGKYIYLDSEFPLSMGFYLPESEY